MVQVFRLKAANAGRRLTHIFAKEASSKVIIIGTHSIECNNSLSFQTSMVMKPRFFRRNKVRFEVNMTFVGTIEKK